VTVVGTAWVELQAMGNKFASSLTGQVAPGLHSVGNTAEHEAGRGRKAFGLMFSTITTNSNGALGPLQDVFEKISNIDGQLGHGRHSAAAWATGIGAAATGAGVLLTTLGDREKIAMNQLKAAVEATGKSWDDYKSPLEDATKTGDHFGYSSAQTAAALNRLVVATNDPKEAIKNLNVTMEIAAARHISLENAARMVGRVYGGSTMILRQFGITTQQMQQPVVDLTKAHMAHHKAVEALHKAEFSLGKVEGEIHAGKLKGAKATWALQQAEQKLSDAQIHAKLTAKELALAHKGAAGQAAVADHNLGLLATRLHGQAEAAANTFTGRLRSMGAHIEDTASSIGQKLGPALTVAGPILMGVGATAETAGGLMRHFSKEGRAARAMLQTLEEAKTTQAAANDAMTASQVTLNEAQTLGAAANAELAGTVEATAVAEDSAAASGAAMDLALGPILLIGAAIAALGIGVYEAYEHFKPFREIVNDIGHYLEVGFMGAVHGVETAFHWLVGVVEKYGGDVLHFLGTWGPVALAVLVPFIGIPLLIATHFHQIVTFLEGLGHDVSHIFGDIKTDAVHIWNDIVHGVEHIVTGFVHREITGFENLWHGITGVVGHLASDIWSGMTGAMTKAGGAVTRGLAALLGDITHWVTEVPTLLLHAGEDLITGFIHGIENKAGDIENAIKHSITDHVPHFVKKALGIFSPSKVMAQLGNDTALGYAAGLEAGAKHVHKGAKHMTSAAKKAASEHKKEMELEAKRTSFRQALGLDVHGGTLGGFTGNASQISSTFNKVVGLLNRAASLGTISTQAANSFENSMLKTKTHLQSLAATVSDVGKKLVTAQADLKAVKDQAAQYASGVASNIEGMGDIVKLSATADVMDAINGMQDAVTQAQQFDTELGDLAKKGLSTKYLDQIAQAGLSGGGKLTADTFETASAAQIQQVNDLQAQLTTAATKVGNTASTNMYGAGIKAAQGIVDGLASQEKALEAQMDRIADTLVSAIQKKLKIHSPSQVFHDIGAMIPHGMANGIAANAHMVHSQLNGLLDGSSASLAGRAGRVGGSPPIGTTVTDPSRAAALVAAVQASLASSGHGGGQLPLLYVAGDLVVRSHQDIDNINRSLFVAGQNVSRAKG
jgi:hypothetical protein